jgi:uncharacterized membrane protein
MLEKLNQHKVNIAFALTIVGLMDALYLSYARYMSVDLPCSITNGGCSVVAASPYAVMLGVPLAYLGVLFYLIMFGALSAYVYKPSIKYIREAILTIAIFGALDSLYFLYLQAYVIKAFCIYCIISAVITFALVLITSVIYKFRS